MILAVDPGLGTFGWAVVRPHLGAVVACGVLIAKPDPKLSKHADRERRAEAQAELLVRLARAHAVTMLAAEEMSFAPRGSAAAKIGIGLSWGNLIGIARALELRRVTIPPKTWQRAIVPARSGEKKSAAIDYACVCRELAVFVDAHATGLDRVAESQKNHALDACGIGVVAALRYMPPAAPAPFHVKRKDSLRR